MIGGTVLLFVRTIRAAVMRFLRPANKYFQATKSIQPLSSKFGFDRGTPIDRYWIDSFIKQNSRYIHGRCLEIGDRRYTSGYGIGVTKSEILDLDPNNKTADIIGDLRNLSNVINSGTYDCIILTHVLGMIDDYYSALSECYRILKPGGTLLVTVSTLSPTYNQKFNYWRFTPASARYVFAKIFGEKNIMVGSYGNVLAGQCFWVGMAQEELTKEQLEFNDPRYPCISTIRATKVG